MNITETKTSSNISKSHFSLSTLKVEMKSIWLNKIYGSNAHETKFILEGNNRNYRLEVGWRKWEDFGRGFRGNREGNSPLYHCIKEEL